MTRRLALLTLLALGACGPATAATLPGPAAPGVASAPQLFVLEGKFLSPIENGGRVAIANGWIEARFSPFPPAGKSNLDVLVVSATKAPAQAEVAITYEMLEMDHGALTQRAAPAVAGHRAASLDLVMRGTWRFTVSVELEGVTSTAVLVLRES